MLERALFLLGAGMLLASPVAAGAAGSNGWPATLERVSTGVVTIQVDATRAFDTEWNTSSQATGFVVDAKLGLILTNRHVVTPGPVTAKAVFLDREEVELKAVYRDPVHDFGFYRYDPSKLRFIRPAELPLYPEGAQVGTEIRVVGNDAGEQLSILAGTLARLDREAPNYGVGKYNDFNTFYMQAASGTSGGSSGSPVIDVDGRVIALNAGGSTGAQSSFYLPLDRVVRALHLIRAGQAVPRGTLQTVFKYTPYDELRRLGLQTETEARAREAFPARTGMLVVAEVQPGSPADGRMAVGDILVGVGGGIVTDFDALAKVLDDSVGAQLALEMERGGTRIVQHLEVSDLYSLLPDRYLEIGDSVLHSLSWQMARHMNVPVRGVFVANPGYLFGPAGIPRGAVIVELAGTPVATLEDATRLLAGMADGQLASVKYFTIDDTRSPELKSVRVDRRWFPARSCHRDDVLGLWPCDELAPPPASEPDAVASTRFARSGDRVLDTLAPSLVQVSFTMPYSVSGVTERNYHGTGVIVDAGRGLVAVDRNTVPVAAGDVRITFAGTLEVPGRVSYVHPLHNLALVAYDPAAIGDTPVRAVTLLRREVVPGDEVIVAGLKSDGRLAAQRSQAGSIDPVNFPLSRTLQFRESNLSTVRLVNGPADFDGVIADSRGRVLALWSSFAFENGRQMQQENQGVPAEIVLETLAHARDGRPLFSLEAELAPRSLAEARRLGLAGGWIRRIEEHSPARREALSVTRLVAGSAAAAVLRPGDLLLAIDGAVVNSFREVERALASERARVTIWRDGGELEVELATAPLTGRDIDRIVMWAGATLHEPHRAMSAQRGIPPRGVFVAFFMYGAPASRYQLWAGRRIVEVDGVPTPDLDAFLDAVAGRPDRSSLRLKTVNWNDSVDVITLKLDKHYWPAYQLRRAADSWIRSPIE
ncbi:MAG: trypsin-like peptidase domain-containing protein [Gammaproteobacteria bacterium]|nr:trypsin-like peptidase domain-containing protein [Gammaproteobacteria bacterium]